MARPADPMAKANLLRAARAEFSEVGLLSARVEDIAKRAKLGKGSFYLHFKTKEEAFQALVDSFFAELARFTQVCKADTACAGSIDEWREALRAQDEQMLEFLWDNRDLLRMINKTAGPSERSVLDSFLDAQVAYMLPEIEGMQKRGLYRKDVDAETVCVAIVGAWNDLCRRMTQSNKKPDVGKTIDTLLKLFLQGLDPRKEK